MPFNSSLRMVSIPVGRNQYSVEMHQGARTLEEWLLVTEILDYTHGSEQLLKQSCTLICPLHGLLANTELSGHCSLLEWDDEQKETESCQRRRTKLDEQDDQTDCDLQHSR